MRDFNISVIVSENKARAQKTEVRRFQSTGYTSVFKDLNVVQAAGSPFITLNSLQIIVDNTAQSILIQGLTNVSSLSYSTPSGFITLPGTYIANGNSTSNGAAISGDPGASAPFTFVINVSVSANTSSSDRTQNITISGNGVTSVISILQHKS